MSQTWAVNSRMRTCALLLVAAAALAAAVVVGSPEAGARSLPSLTVGSSTTDSTAATDPPTTIPLTLPATTTPSTLPVTTTARASATTAPHTTVPRTFSTGGLTVPPAVTAKTVPATTTTILGIGGRVPAAPSTVPLQTTGSNGHVSSVFAWLSGIGFAIALALVAARLIVTRAGSRDRAPLTSDGAGV